MTTYWLHLRHVLAWTLKLLGTSTVLSLCLAGLTIANTMVVMASFIIIVVVLAAWVTWGYDFARKWWLLVLLLPLIGGCARVDPGHVGLKVNYYGSNRGVADFPIVTGMVWYNPISTTVFQFPTFVQTAVWSHSPNEGKAVNEEISFNSREGLVFTADISLSYFIKPERAAHFYVKFRSDDMGHFTHGFMRNVARDAFNESSVQYNADEIYGDKKEALLGAVKKRINDQFQDIGVVLDQFGFIGAPRPPQNVVDAINMKIKATQDAIRVENELRASKAEAAKSVATAEGRAKAILIEAEAQAKANMLLSASLSQQLVQLKAIERWNGIRPTVEGGNSGGLLLSLPVK